MIRPRQNDLLGRMMKKHQIDAQEVLLADLCYPDQIGQYGIPAAGEPYTKDKNRYLRITDISDDGLLLDVDKKGVSGEIDERYFLSEGDVVFARTGNSTGRSYLYDKKDGRLVYAGFLIKYKLDPAKVNPRYIHYFTQSAYYKAWVKNLSVGSTRGNISATTFAECPIYLPDRTRQDRLVDVLSAIDRKIALNRKRIATLEAMAKEIYDYWFVQFDFPDAHGRPYKSSGGAMVYNPDLKREIPKGWEVCEIGCLSEIKSGYPFRSDALIENGVHGVITIKNVQDYQLDLSQLCYINEIPEGMPDFCKVQNGACLMSLTGYVGRICRVHKVGFLLNQRVGVVIPKVESREWLYAMLGEQGLRAKINYLATGCAQVNVSPVDIGKIRVPLPTSELRNRYDEIAKYLMAEIFACRKECDELASLRDFLLPVLMNGQVKVG